VTEQPPIPQPDEGLPSVAGRAGSAAPAPEPGAPAIPQVTSADLASSDDAAVSVDGAAVSPIDRPEVAVGAAFAGGLLLALILKRLAR